MLDYNLPSQSARFTSITAPAASEDNNPPPFNLLPANLEKLAFSFQGSPINQLLVENIKQNQLVDLQINPRTCYIYAWKQNDEEFWLAISQDTILAKPDIVPDDHVLIPCLSENDQEPSGMAVTVMGSSFELPDFISENYEIISEQNDEAWSMFSSEILRIFPPLGPQGCADEADCVPPLKPKPPEAVSEAS